MNKTLYTILFIAVVVLALIGFKIFGSDKDSSTGSNTFTKSSDNKKQTELVANNQTPDKENQSGVVFSNEPLDSTGIRYSSYEGPKADVETKISIGNSNIEPKTITAKEGQRVSITFTSGIRDEMHIEGYNASTYVEPGRESTIQFQANKSGKFSITLVQTKKTIGTLIIN